MGLRICASESRSRIELEPELLGCLGSGIDMLFLVYPAYFSTLYLDPSVVRLAAKHNNRVTDWYHCPTGLTEQQISILWLQRAPG